MDSLEQFNETLIQTGNEPEVARQRGEEVEAVTPPSPDEFPSATAGEAAAAGADDFFSNLSESLAGDEGEEAPDGLAPPEDDFLSELGLEDEEPPLPEFPGEEVPDEESLFEAEQPAESPASLEPQPPVEDEAEVQAAGQAPETDQEIALGGSDDLDAELDNLENQLAELDAETGMPEEADQFSADFDEGFEDFDAISEEDISSDFAEEPEDLDAEDLTADEEDPGEVEDFEDFQEPEDVFGGDFGLDEETPSDLSSESEEDLSSDFSDELPDDFDEDFAGDFSEPNIEDDLADLSEEAPSASVPDEEEDAGIPEESEDFQFDDSQFGEGQFEEGQFDTGDEFPEISPDADFGDFDTSGSEFEDLSAADAGTGETEPSPAAEDFSAGLEDFSDFDEDFDASDFGDEFSMGDFGAEFGIMEDEGTEESFAQPEEEGPEAASGEGPEEALEEASLEDEAQGYQISEKEFQALKENLAQLPLNLKIEAADVVTSGEYPFDQVKKVIDALKEGTPPRDLARIVGKITGKKIEIPKGYTKLSGKAFAEEQDSFAYRFRMNIWPVLRLMLAGTAMLGALLFLGYRYVYQPLYARGLYEQGLENIALQEYERGNRLFTQAYDVWPVNTRYLDYARAFRDERQFALAREKYETLLSPGVEPLNRNAILEYAGFSTRQLRDYETSLEYLNRLIEEDVWDYDARLGRGDTYLEWGIQLPPGEARDERFENARFEYASLMQEYGQRDELLFRMLRYFIHTNRVEEALNLKDLFLSDENATIEPRGMAELGGFLLDLVQGKLGQVENFGEQDAVQSYIDSLKGESSRENLLNDSIRVLNKAMAVDDQIADIHYHRARYSRITGDFQDEITALTNARELYEETRKERPLTRREIAREIDTHIREGENLYRLEELISSETRLREAADLYETALDARKVEPHPDFGRLYARLGDIYYYHANDYSSAQARYEQARNNEYASLGTPGENFRARQDIAYKMGFIHYFRANELRDEDQGDVEDRQELLDEAISEFNNAMGAVPTANLNLLYARANTQYQRENFNDAAGMYRILLDELTAERASISTFLLEEDDRHKALIDFQVRANNNLGVTLYELYRQGGERSRDFLAQSQLFLSRSTELAENLVRDEETAVRADTKPLAFLNLNQVLAPEGEAAVQINPDIRKDLETPTF
ncbi:periplasmic flagellar collar protein FlcA [Salinispira pacifica]|nr:hypothetical protein [Salinispira pacifica]